VNWLAATLSTAGIIYYSYVYTILLKRMTPQNIVIGGGAGAIPPLVGWAAVTDELSLLALYLFAIIFLWTPPHTWALMLLLDKDYRKVSIPMLPTAWGELEARRHIILYSILLFIVTVMPFLFGGLGWIYLVGAVVLGAYFLVLATRLWFARENPKPIAKRLYSYSNGYLALLFAVMVLDAFLIR
jgi:protoheme IX farnesyltransferase